MEIRCQVDARSQNQHVLIVQYFMVLVWSVSSCLFFIIILCKVITTGEDKLDDGKIGMHGYIEMHGRQCDACGVLVV